MSVGRVGELAQKPPARIRDQAALAEDLGAGGRVLQMIDEVLEARSAADGEGRRLVKRWFEDAGLEVRVDKIGNVYGRRRARDPKKAAVLSGSHIDSVPTAGIFDGCLGVLGALEVVRTLDAAQIET